VDDGSLDGTPEILRRHAERCDWIQILRIERREERASWAGGIYAFLEGYKLISAEDFDFIVNLDCDLELPEDYFERLIKEFQSDPSLGIASGLHLENGPDGWRPIVLPPYHAAGASKMLRRKCYNDIGGFVPSRGWDTVDEIRAQYAGWKTKHFPEVQFRHLKEEGTEIGSLRTQVLHGEVYFLSGGGIVFFLFKVLDRAVRQKPVLFAGLAMVWGYLRCWASGRKRLVGKAEARFYRRMLNQRLRAVAAKLVGRAGPRTEAWV
jgi:glycosyltransferase involved in cell wall biosynthesis